MKIKLIFFGAWSEQAGAAEAEWDNPGDTESLKKALEQKYPAWAGKPYTLAVNRVICRENRELKGGEEVAVMPPFAGG